MMKYLSAFTALFVAAPAIAEAPKPYAIYYTAGASAAQLAPYKLLVLDSHAHPDLRSLRGRMLLGYISLAEVGEYRPFYPHLRDAGVTLGAIASAPGHVYLDVRKPEWAQMVVEHLIPELLRKGFDGIMLDTADTALNQDKTYPGMADATAALIRLIRLHYPDMPMMLNRGFALLPQIAGVPSHLMAESIYTTYDKDGFHLQPSAHYASVAEMLTQYSQAHNTPIYTVDYWPTEDRDGVKAIYTAQRQHGFLPYAATPDLQTIIPEPE